MTKARVAGGTTQVYQSAFCQQNNAFAVREDDVVNLRLDVFPGASASSVLNVDFIVEVADVADDGLVFHFGAMCSLRMTFLVAGGGDEDVGEFTGVIDGQPRGNLPSRPAMRRWDRFR